MQGWLDDFLLKIYVMLFFNWLFFRSIVELLKPTSTGLLKIKQIDGNNCIGVCEIAHDFLDHVDKIKNMWENYSEDNSIT